MRPAGWATACYEIFGACGIILSGLLMDRVFHGRGAKACFVYMLGCLIASFTFWKLDSDSLVLNILIMSMIGFFIYGPQCLIGCVAATIATKKSGDRDLRCPSVVQFCRAGDKLYAPTSDLDGLQVMFFPFIGKEGL